MLGLGEQLIERLRRLGGEKGVETVDATDDDDQPQKCEQGDLAAALKAPVSGQRHAGARRQFGLRPAFDDAQVAEAAGKGAGKVFGWQ